MGPCVGHEIEAYFLALSRSKIARVDVRLSLSDLFTTLQQSAMNVNLIQQRLIASWHLSKEMVVVEREQGSNLEPK